MPKESFDFTIQRIHTDTTNALNIYETVSNAPNFSWVCEKVTCVEV